MSTKKIATHQAYGIAARVSAKAFEHLLSPLQEKLEKAGMDAYNAWYKDIGLSANTLAKMLESGALTMRSGIIIEVGTKDDRVLVGDHSYNGSATSSPFVCSRMRMPPGKVADDILVMLKQYERIEHSRGEMLKEIRDQLTGKTVSYAAKTWPEIAEFIFDQTGRPAGEVMVVPFQALINKYLAALPAPAPAAN